MENLLKLEYKGKPVRTILRDGEQWWVLVDVCKVLKLTNPTVVASRLDKDEVAKFDLGGLSGESHIINESGLYSVLLRSDKPEAKPFKRWVTHEVLPRIRKTGMYSMQNAPAAPPVPLEPVIATCENGDATDMIARLKGCLSTMSLVAKSRDITDDEDVALAANLVLLTFSEYCRDAIVRLSEMPFRKVVKFSRETGEEVTGADLRSL